MTSRAIIERERRWALPAALAAFAPLLLLVASIAVQQSAGIVGADSDSEQLRSIDENSGALIASSILAAVGLALLALPLVHLFRAAQARSDAVRGALIGFAVIGPVLLAAQGVANGIAVTDVAADFVSRAAGVADAEELADRLIEDSSAVQTAQSLFIPAILAMLVGMIYIPLQAVRTGLLTRFFGTLAMALGASLILLPQVSVFVILLWFAWLGLIFLGRVPGGRPPAWDAGAAIPWPQPGDEEPEPGAPVEGEAREVEPVPEAQAGSGPGDGTPPQKRKRRR